MRIVSIRENTSDTNRAIAYFQQSWKGVLPIIYEDCISHSINGRDSLPQWYLLQKADQIIGCAGLVTNDFISRGDLYPWLCALYIEDDHRGHAYSTLLMDKAKSDTKDMGYQYLYLSTSHIGFYEKYNFYYIGQGYHPWGGESRIYECKL